MKHIKQSILSKDGINYLIPFILITFLYIVVTEYSFYKHDGVYAARS